MKLEVLELALQAIELLRPIVVRIKKHDRNLARQITDAANSNVLNTAKERSATPERGAVVTSPRPAVPTRCGWGSWLPVAGATPARRPRPRCSLSTIAS
jgi:hypothetical protein